MEMTFSRSWKALGARGLVCILFGLLVFLWPGMTLAALVVLFGVYALVDGLLAVAAGTRQRVREHVWVLGLEGLIGIGVGLAVLVWTGSAAHLLVQVIALWAILTGALEITASVRLRQEIPGEPVLFVAGCASGLLGLLMLVWPGAGALMYALLLGSYALFFGTAMLLLAFRMRRTIAQHDHLHHDLDAMHPT